MTDTKEDGTALDGQGCDEEESDEDCGKHEDTSEHRQAMIHESLEDDEQTFVTQYTEGDNQ